MAADEKLLGELHNLVATQLIEMVKGTDLGKNEETGENIVMPPSAAVIAAAAAFLKQNNITCTPSKDNALGELSEAMKAREEKRKARRAALPSQTDLDAATEGMNFMGGMQ